MRLLSSFENPRAPAASAANGWLSLSPSDSQEVKKETKWEIRPLNEVKTLSSLKHLYIETKSLVRALLQGRGSFLEEVRAILRPYV